jgi:hypothetical protein
MFDGVIKAMGITCILVSIAMLFGISVAGMIQYPLFNTVAATLAVYRAHPLLLPIQAIVTLVGIILSFVKSRD